MITTTHRTRRVTLWRATIAACTALTLATGALVAPAHAAEPTDGTAASSTDGVHKDGFGISPMSLPADTTNTLTGKTHECAGRSLLYHGHIDTPYITRDADGQLQIMAVDGTKVIPNDAMCLRLGRDSSQGKEVSRFVVPDDPKLSFLGAPGTILWISPMQLYSGWKPLWAGYGAFDPHHENTVPGDYVGDVVDLAITDFDGPGDMEVFNYFPGWKRPNRLLSSKDIRHNTVIIGGHGHMNWTFSKPGIYHVTYTATAKKFDGTIVSSKPVTQVWLVGDDKDVGLKDGTTIDLDGSGTSAEAQRTAMGLSDPGDSAPAAAPAPTPNQPLIDGEPLIASIRDNFPPQNLDTTISSGAVELGFSPDEDGYLSTSWKHDGKAIPGSAYIEVTDDQLTCADPADPYLGAWVSSAGKTSPWMTSTPADARKGNGVSLNLDTGWAPFDELNDQKEFFEFSPSDANPGSMLIGVDTKDGLVPLTVEGSVVSKSVQLLTPGSHPVRVAFSHPGIYTADVTAKGEKRQSKPGDTSFVSTYGSVKFIVGNDAINAWRSAIDPKAPLLPTNASRSCGDRTVTGANPVNYPVAADGTVVSPLDEETKTTPTLSPTTTTPVPEPTVTPTSTPSAPKSSSRPSPEAAATVDELRALWGTSIPNHIVTEGHMDLALDNEAENGATAAHLHDEAVADHEVLRDSGTFAFAVPSSTKITTLPDSFVKGTGFTGEVYSLPQVQQTGVPWVGFNTNETTDPLPGGVTITIADFDGPGRLVTGHILLSGEVDKLLDSADPTSKIVYKEKAHDHQYWWFSAPGAYKVTLRYAWKDADGNDKTSDLVASFLVGDKTIANAAKVIKDATSTPATSTPATTTPATSTPKPTDVPETSSPQPTSAATTPASTTENPQPPAPKEPTKHSSSDDSGSAIIGAIAAVLLLLPMAIITNPQLRDMVSRSLPPGVTIPGL